MKVYIVRHGQTLFNYLERVQGWSDSPLTALGVKQGQTVAKYLSDVQFDQVYSSDAKRAIDTANFIIDKQATPVTIQTTPLLREAYFGGFEGGTNDAAWASVVEKFGYDKNLILTDFDYVRKDLAGKISNEDFRNTIAEKDPLQLAENFEQFSSRIQKFIDDVLVNNEAENVLLVNHGGTVQRLIELLLADETGYSETNNSSTTIIEINLDGNKMVDFNNISYFEEDDIS